MQTSALKNNFVGGDRGRVRIDQASKDYIWEMIGQEILRRRRRSDYLPASSQRSLNQSPGIIGLYQYLQSKIYEKDNFFKAGMCSEGNK